MRHSLQQVSVSLDWFCWWCCWCYTFLDHGQQLGSILIAKRKLDFLKIKSTMQMDIWWVLGFPAMYYSLFSQRIGKSNFSYRRIFACFHSCPHKSPPLNHLKRPCVKMLTTISYKIHLLRPLTLINHFCSHAFIHSSSNIDLAMQIPL